MTLFGSPPGCGQASLVRGGGITIGLLRVGQVGRDAFRRLDNRNAAAGKRLLLFLERIEFADLGQRRAVACTSCEQRNCDDRPREAATRSSMSFPPLLKPLSPSPSYVPPLLLLVRPGRGVGLGLGFSRLSRSRRSRRRVCGTAAAGVAGLPATSAASDVRHDDLDAILKRIRQRCGSINSGSRYLRASS